MKVIRIYNSKLDDREKRKRFVIDRGLVDKREQIAVRAGKCFIFYFLDFFLTSGKILIFFSCCKKNCYKKKRRKTQAFIILKYV